MPGYPTVAIHRCGQSNRGALGDAGKYVLAHFLRGAFVFDSTFN
jgi:hypothetical protein